MTQAKVRVNDENIFTWLTAANWVLLAFLALAGLLVGSPLVAGSIVAGGLLAIVNFYWLLSVLKRVLQMPLQQAGRFAQIRYILRLAVMGLAMWALIRFVGINVIGLLIGLSITVVNIIVLALIKVARKGG